MARTQSVELPDGTRTWTVTEATHLPHKQVEEYLAYLRIECSPNTVKTYAGALTQWITVLETLERNWHDFPTTTFGEFIKYVRSGDLPGTNRIGEPAQERSTSTVQNRVAAVLAFYTWQLEANGHEEPYARLYSAKRRSGRSAYKPFLAGISKPADTPASIYKVRSGPKGRTPVLLPEQVKTILDSCSTQKPDGEWTGSAAGLRDRLLFATLAETGMRLGQAMSLHNQDWHIGAGRTPWIELVPRQDHPHGLRNKTPAGRRIYIGDDLEALYSAYIWHLYDHGIDAYIQDVNAHFTFVNIAKGEPFEAMRPETVYAKKRSISRRHDQLPSGWTPHWFRHTHATALLLSGVEPHVVMRRLGHAQIQTTLDHYGWVTEDAELRTVSQWREFVNGWKGLHAQ